MSDQVVRIPGPDHPITIESTAGRVIVTVAGKVVADTTRALTLREGRYAPVQYIPRRDVDPASLRRTETSSYCPYKGNASYFSVPAGGSRSVDAAWTYEAPFEAVGAIADHVAFYSERVDAIKIQD